MQSDITQRADFSRIRYSQCWEDADVLLDGLDLAPEATCLSIASAGDNTLALLTTSPKKVVAVDLSHSQLYCLEFRMAAFAGLEYDQMLQVLGFAPCEDRQALYKQIRQHMSADAVVFWNQRPSDVARGISHIGRFENYLQLFRTRMLPMVHTKARIRQLFQQTSQESRQTFYADRWNTLRWKAMFHLFFSRPLLGRLGRDPEFFRYVRGQVAPRIHARVSHALTRLHPSRNPYLQWILLGRYEDALPVYLRRENFDTIRSRLGAITLYRGSLEEYLDAHDTQFDGFNLSNIFEYIGEAAFQRLYGQILAHCREGARLAYWNLFVPRRAPGPQSSRVLSVSDSAAALHWRDKAFFYCDFVLEESK